MINDYENTLRNIILQIKGDDPIGYGISPERIAKWNEKKDINFKKNKELLFESRIIYYSDFYDLKSIILKNWDMFKLIFHDRKRFEVFNNEMENYRNDIAHGRTLTQSQEKILAGITLDLKTLITIYHNKNEMKEDFFVRIEKVSDNLGNVWDGNTYPKVTLRVGDYYELLIEAFDPKGRKIKYEVSSGMKFDILQDTPRFTFAITNDLVRQSKYFFIQAFTPESEYKNSDAMDIGITILPR